MGTIVQFDLLRQGAPRPKPERPCEVTIFPGVRYERAPADTAAGLGASATAGAGADDTAR